MTRAEKEAALARAHARQVEIEHAQERYDSLSPERRSALRASFDYAENEAVKLVRMRRREAPES